MGEIRQYVSGESPYADIGGRNSTASDFGASGAVLGGLSQDIGGAAAQLQQRAQQEDVANAHVALSQARLKWTRELQGRAQTDQVYNPDFADKFTTDLHDDVSNIGNTVQTRVGQQAFQEGLANLTTDLSGSAGVYQAQAAGVKAKNDYQTYLNNGQNTLFHAPEQFGSVVADARAALDNPAGPYARLQASVREQLAREGANSLAKSAMQGLIDKDPQTALNEIEAGVSPMTKALDADSIHLLEREAKQGIDAKLIDKARLRAAQEQAWSDNDNALMNNVITKLGQDPTSVSAADLLKLPFHDYKYRTLGLGLVQQGLGGKQADENIYDNTFNELFGRIHLPDGDPDKITDPDVMNDYVTGGTLDFPRLAVLRNEITGKGADADAEKKMTSALDSLAEKSLVTSDPITHVLDPGDQEGQRALYTFRIWFLQNYQAQRDKGKTAVQLLDPNSQDYMGKMIAVLAGQRKSFPGLGVGANGLLAPDAATPGVPAPAAAATIDTSKADKTATGAKGKIYHIDGQWVDAQGNPVVK